MIALGGLGKIVETEEFIQAQKAIEQLGVKNKMLKNQWDKCSVALRVESAKKKLEKT